MNNREIEAKMAAENLYRINGGLAGNQIQTSQAASGGLGAYGGTSNYEIPQPPTEPSPMRRAAELLGYLHELHSIQGDLRSKLFGPIPESGIAGQKDASQPCLDEMLQRACQMAANLVGEARTINGKLG